MPKRLVPTFRSSCSIAASASTNFGKSWATHKPIDSSAAFLFEVPGSNSPLVVQELQIGGASAANLKFLSVLRQAPHSLRTSKSELWWRNGFSDAQLHIVVRADAPPGMTAKLQADLPDGQITVHCQIGVAVQPSFKKYFASPFGRNSFTDSAVPSFKRGGSRSSRTRGGMRWTLQRS